MNKQKIFFILTITGILILLFLTQIQKPIIEGTISEIKYSQNKITILLKNQETEIILFTENPLINLKENKQIAVYGKKEIYKNKPQIIADKIIYLNS